MLPTFAQSGFGLIDPPAPAPLPQPPLLERYLFENPWPLTVLLAVAAAVCFLRLRAAGRTRPALVTAACLLAAAAGEWVLAASVRTGRESITDRTSALVGAAAAVDIAALDDLLSEELSLFRPGGGPGLTKSETLDRVRQYLGSTYLVSDWAVLDTQASTESARSGETQARVRITLRDAGFPNISWWRIDWRKAPDGAWRAVTIEPVSVTPDVRSQLR